MPDFINAFPKPVEESNFLAAAVRLNSESEIEHAGIIVKYLDKYKVFHFVNKLVHFEDIDEDDWFFYKKIKVVSSQLVGSFYNLCLKVKGELAPRFGYHIDKSIIKNDGEYLSLAGIPFITTCVGFCLTMLRNVLLGQEFIQIEDWDSKINLGNKEELIEKYIEKYKIEYPEFEEAKFRENIRRILPIEYFVAAYFDNTPVRKVQIDSLTQIVSGELKNEVA